MWLMPKHGFYSIVQKKPDEYPNNFSPLVAP